MKKEYNPMAKAFITAIGIIAVLMVLTYILSLIIPAGEYDRTIDTNGNSVITSDSEYKNVEGGIPFFKWLMSPVLLLFAEGNGTVIAIILFLLIIGGIFECLNKCGLIKYILDKIVFKFEKTKYKLMAAITFFFMFLGSFIGSFEECVPLVPIIVALSVSLGWDAFTGLGMSLLAIGCGFSAGICNPFTIGVAQKLCGLPTFSGIWLRAISFLIIYFLLLLFLICHAKKNENKKEEFAAKSVFIKNVSKDKATVVFSTVMFVGLALILSSAFITVLQNYTMIIVAAMFLFAGIPAALVCKTSKKDLLSSFGKGVASVFPAVLMILMASSIKYTLVEAKILDTVLHYAVSLTENLPRELIILFIYIIVMIMNFFISSGSAKAVLLIPLITPLAQIYGISSQLCVLAYAFGDGFSNVMYPTNPVLLISLGLANVSYTIWFRWTFKFQLANFIVTSLILLLGLTVGY